MPYYIYILESLKDGKHYIGSTANVAARLEFHNAGLQRSTKHRTPFKIVYVENFETKQEALVREKQIKNYKGGNAFRALLNCGGE